MISIDIEKRLNAYKGQQLLKVKTEIPIGSITKIYGPSGGGKTTFLKIIAGLVKPQIGTILVNETLWLDTTKKISLSPQKRKTGFVFQNYALFPNMTIRQHLEYATDDKPWINRLLSIGKLDSFENHKPAYLSGGQQQRLAILRAMAMKPAVLLMDEPFSALDPKMKSELIGELEIIWNELGSTTLIVSHNLPELGTLPGQELYLESR